ncbi:MAG: glycosyltransferase family 2 protein [Epsilonproteobacteria bacterium]|nr:glycosyltransferase family 2 protein [Campylobacterota bacterium]
MKTALYFLIYILFILIIGFLIPYQEFDPYARKLIFFLGLVGIWRYTWFSLNIARSLIYKKIRFKKIREMEQNSNDDIDPEHIFILITTFRIGTSVSAEVYRAAIKEAIECGYDVTLIASIVEMSEERLVRKIFLELNPPKRVKLIISKIAGTGKRDGLSVGFRVIANSPVNLFRSVVAVVDGDSILSTGTLRKSARLFGLNEKLGALTTDEDARLDGKDFVTNIYRRWYRLRFAQRNVNMSSLALSNRVLTLTGRMSMIRANIVADREFVDTVQNDFIEHWRLGRFRFLTGDDKSSWYYVIKNGWDMLYVPDVMVYTIEEIPHKNYFIGSLMLMQRWFGNQYRTNKRALDVPKEVLGSYAWYALWDQRFTMWTSPYGLFIAFFGAIHWGAYVFGAYLWWVLLSRLLMTFAYRTSREDILPSWPFFLYYNQIVGSFVKIYIWNHLYKQSWTRQKTKLSAGDRFSAWYQIFSSNSMLLAQFLFFLIIVNFLVQNINFDDLWAYFDWI